MARDKQPRVATCSDSTGGRKPDERNHRSPSGIAKLIAAIVADIVEVKYGKRYEDETNKQIATWTGAVAYWTKWLVGVGFISAVILTLQYCTFVQTEKTIRGDQRAWVGLDGGVAIDVLETNPRLVVESHYSIKNFGKGPAIKVVPIGRFETDAKLLGSTARFACDSAVKFATNTVPHGPDLKAPGAFGYTLFPGQGRTEVIGGPNDPWQGDGMPDLKHFWFIGCVAYLDQFDTVHWTRFCMEPDMFSKQPLSRGTALTFCSLYNDTDESQASERSDTR